MSFPNIKPILTINFEEVATGEECVVIVRVVPNGVAIALSRKSDGDVEVVLPTIQARELSRTLSAAIGEAERVAE